MKHLFKTSSSKSMRWWGITLTWFIFFFWLTAWAYSLIFLTTRFTRMKNLLTISNLSFLIFSLLVNFFFIVFIHLFFNRFSFWLKFWMTELNILRIDVLLFVFFFFQFNVKVFTNFRDIKIIHCIRNIVIQAHHWVWSVITWAYFYSLTCIYRLAFFINVI